MAKVQPINTVSARRSAAIAAISSGRIHSQEDLVQALKKAGYAVTQATASNQKQQISQQLKNVRAQSKLKKAQKAMQSVRPLKPIKSL